MNKLTKYMEHVSILGVMVISGGLSRMSPKIEVGDFVVLNTLLASKDEYGLVVKEHQQTYEVHWVAYNFASYCYKHEVKKRENAV
jgi:hypothetical protein